MAKACDRERCPSRADVDDAKTTEYRKGCRLTPCTRANSLDTQRRRAAKAAKQPETAAALTLVTSHLVPPAAEDDVDEDDQVDTAPDTWGAFDIVAAVRADLAAIEPTHPMHRSLSAIAMTLANQLQMAAGVITPSARGAASQLQATLQLLAPAKKDGAELDEILAELLADDDDDDAQPAG